MRCKIVYDDSGITKVIKGNLNSEDNFFFNIETFDKVSFRINKQHVISFKELKEGEMR